MNEHISIIGTPMINEDGLLCFIMTNGKYKLKVEAVHIDGEGYKIKNYEVFTKGGDENEEPGQVK